VNPRRRSFAAFVLTIATLGAACGSEDSSTEPAGGDEATTTVGAEPTNGDTSTTEAEGDTTTTTGGGEAPSGELAAGEVFVTGSSTVEPISGRVSELAAEESGGALAVTVEGPGTGDGFEIFCGGEADVTGASRPIKDEEAQACTDGGVNYVELKVGLDGLTVATSPNNSTVECLDPAALYALIGPESEGFDSWADANTIAGELGSAYATLPDAPLVISGPGEESGTYDTFVEFAIAGFAEERGQEEATRADYTSSANDNLIVQGIEGSDTSIGWVGFAYYKAEGERMKAINIANDTGECVAPTDETVADGSYPFSRDLYIYVNTDNAASNPAVASYVDLYLSEAGIAKVGEAGYVAPPAADLDASRAAWEGARG
jgi:phosphate transport system substrate-binding protein